MTDAPEAAPELPPWRVERILFDQGGLLVVDKPIHLPVHGGDETLEHSVVDRLGTFLKSRGRRDYLGVHSRLDQETSGVLLFTTDEGRNAEVALASEKHELRRVYQAVVRSDAGSRLAASGRIELLLNHDKDRTTVVTRGGKRAVTHYRVLARQAGRALVELELETGRTHQIRVSLAHMGSPVVGDRLYGGDAASRQFLHATELSGGPLPGPVQSPAPPSFERALMGSVEISPLELEGAVADAACLRSPLPAHTSTFRLFNSDGDGVPGLVVDSYGKSAAVGIYDEALLPLVDALVTALQRLGYLAAFLKKRVRRDLRAEDAKQLAPAAPLFGAPEQAEGAVIENGRLFGVSLSDGLSTGLFVDQRDNRQRAVGWARAGRMLNLFCYTGSFSVAAAQGGARTVSVDLSGRALARARDNFELNGFSLDGHQFIKEDAMKYLARAVRRGDSFDLIVLDPPSFATVGKGTFSVKGRYVEAAAHCLRLLAPGGRLLAVTNHTATPRLAFRRMLSEAAERAGLKLVALKDMSSGLDCPDGPEGPWPSKSLLATVP